MFVGMLLFAAVVKLVPEVEMEGDGASASAHGHGHGASGSKPAAIADAPSTAAPGGSAPAAASASAPAMTAAESHRLMMTGIIAAVGISLHNLPEGLVVYTATITGVACEGSTADMTAMEYVTGCLGRGLAITFAIALHNIPGACDEVDVRGCAMGRGGALFSDRRGGA